MTLLFSTGFERGTIPSTADEATAVNNPNSNFSIISSNVRTGAYSLQCAAGSTETPYIEFGGINAAGDLSNNINSRDTRIRLALRITAFPASPEPFLEVRHASGRKCSLLMTGAQRLTLLSSTGGTLFNGTTTFSLNTWYEIDFFVSTGTSAAVMQIWINDTYEGGATGNANASTAAVIRVGRPFNQNSSACTFQFDDIAIDDRIMPDSGGVYALTVAGNTSDAAWSAGTANSYTEIDDITPDSDTTYIECPTTGSPLLSLFTLGSTAGLPSGKRINSLKIAVTGKRTSTSSAFTIYLDMNGTVVQSSQYTLPTTYKEIYLISRYNPVTGLPWTYADLASLKVGVREGNNANPSRVTSIRVDLDIGNAPTSFSGIRKKIGTMSVTATGSLAVTGIGFRPKVILIFGYYGTGAVTDSQQANFQYVSSVFETTYGKVMTLSDTRPDAQGTSSYGSTYAVNSISLITRSNNSTTRTLFNITEVNDDGFRIGTESTGASYKFTYVCLGGDALEVDCHSFNTNGTLGMKYICNTLRFQPDCLLFFSNNILTDSVNMLGVAKDPTHQWCTVSSGKTAQSNSLEYSYQRTDRCVMRSDSASVQAEMSLYSMDANGFQLNFEMTHGQAYDFFALALKGPSVEVGSFLQNAATGTQAITGLTSQPRLLMLASNGKVSGAGNSAQSVRTIGFAQDGATPPTQWGFSCSALNAQATKQNDHYASETKALPILSPGNPATVVGLAGLDTIDSGGFTLNWTTADGTQREVLYLSLGDPASGVAVSGNFGGSSSLSALLGNNMAITTSGITASSALVGAVSQLVATLGDISAASAVDASLARVMAAAGVLAGAGDLSGLLARDTQAEGVIAAVSALQGGVDVVGVVGEEHLIVGQINALSSLLTSVLTRQYAGAGTIDAVSTVQAAALSRTTLASGTIDGSASLTLLAGHFLSVVGSIDGVSNIGAGVSRFLEIVGSPIQGASNILGSLEQVLGLIGSIDGDSNIVSEMQTAMEIAAAIQGVSNLSAILGQHVFNLEDPFIVLLAKDRLFELSPKERQLVLEAKKRIFEILGGT